VVARIDVATVGTTATPSPVRAIAVVEEQHSTLLTAVDRIQIVPDVFGVDMVLSVQTEDEVLHGAIPLVEQVVLGGSVTWYVVRVLIVLDAATAMPAAATTVSATSASNTTILRIRCLLPFAQAATN
jgi:hypothetical protein